MNIKHGNIVRYKDPCWGMCSGFFAEEKGGELRLELALGTGHYIWIPKHWVVEVKES